MSSPTTYTGPHRYSGPLPLPLPAVPAVAVVAVQAEVTGTLKMIGGGTGVDVHEVQALLSQYVAR